MDDFTREWITSNALEEIQNYDKGVLTIRGLHYRLVSRGMTNSMRHYKRVVSAMIKARWDGLVSFDTFSDHDRPMIGRTNIDVTTPEGEAESTKNTIRYWMETYTKNRWENQDNYVEVFIEKKALQGVFHGVCQDRGVALGPCKGYPSLTFLYDAAKRFKNAVDKGKNPIILYFGDYDPSGEDIPRSIKDNLYDMTHIDIEVRRIALMEHQVVEMGLPPAPAKIGDSRTANWDGLGQVELDAVEPKVIEKLCADAIDDVFDDDLYEELNEIEGDESESYFDILKEWIKEEYGDE